jgi:hypothetical protein
VTDRTAKLEAAVRAQDGLSPRRNGSQSRRVEVHGGNGL